MRPDHDLSDRAFKPDRRTYSGVYDPAQFSRASVGISGWMKVRRGVYIFLIFLFGILSHTPEGSDNPPPPGPWSESYAKGYFIGEMFWGGVGMLLSSFAIAALFLAWSRSTRHLIPGTACIVAFFTFVGAVGRITEEAARVAEDAEAQRTALQRWADSLGTGQMSVDDPPPGEMLARLEWAARNAREDFTTYARRRARTHLLDSGSMPAAWGSAAYLANAGKYPAVREHLVRYRGMLQELDTIQGSMAERHMNLRLLQAGFSGAELTTLMDSVRLGVEESSRKARAINADLLAYTDRVLELHELLVRADARAHLNAKTGVAEFERDSELLRVQALLKEVDRLAAVVQSRKAELPAQR